VDVGQLVECIVHLVDDHLVLHRNDNLDEHVVAANTPTHTEREREGMNERTNERMLDADMRATGGTRLGFLPYRVLVSHLTSSCWMRSEILPATHSPQQGFKNVRPGFKMRLWRPNFWTMASWL